MTEVTTGSEPPAAPTPPVAPAAPTAGSRPVKKHHARYIVGVIACVAIVGWMLTVLQKNVVYLRPVSYAVAHRAQQGTQTFRMGGTVVSGSIHQTATGVSFRVTEGGVSANVVQPGSPPDLFKNCAPIVVEGHWAGNTFDSSRLLIRHGSEYSPSKRVDDACRNPNA